MFCPNCGAQINDGGKFCPACGANYAAQATVEERAVQPRAAASHMSSHSAESSKKPRKPRSKTWIPCLITAIVTVVLTIGGFLLTSNTVLKKDEKGWEGSLIVTQNGQAALYMDGYGEALSFGNSESVWVAGRFPSDVAEADAEDMWELSGSSGWVANNIVKASVAIPADATDEDPCGRWGFTYTWYDAQTGSALLCVMSDVLTINEDGTGKLELVKAEVPSEDKTYDEAYTTLEFADASSSAFDPLGEHEDCGKTSQVLEFTWTQTDLDNYECHVTNYDDADFTVNFETAE